MHFSNPSVYPEQVRQDVTVLSHSATTAVETTQGVGSYRKEITFGLRGKLNESQLYSGQSWDYDLLSFTKPHKNNEIRNSFQIKINSY